MIQALFPAGLVFSAEPQRLPLALQSPLFAPHVAVYTLSYMILAKAAIQTVCHLVAGLWSLVSWLVYLIYFHWRFMHGRFCAWMNSLLSIVGLIMIIITLLWVNLSNVFKGMHNYA